jgi:hypothetical protein
MEIPLFQVEAFTDRPFAGNPAAVCLLPWMTSGPLWGERGDGAERRANRLTRSGLRGWRC